MRNADMLMLHVARMFIEDLEAGMEIGSLSRWNFILDMALKSSVYGFILSLTLTRMLLDLSADTVHARNIYSSAICKWLPLRNSGMLLNWAMRNSVWNWTIWNGEMLMLHVVRQSTVGLEAGVQTGLLNRWSSILVRPVIVLKNNRLKLGLTSRGGDVCSWILLPMYRAH